MRLAAPLAIVALLAAPLVGCGGSSSSSGESEGDTSAPQGQQAAPVGATARACESGADEVSGLRASGISCAQARRVTEGWLRTQACSAPAGASRTSCSSGSYRCLGARTGRGLAVSCSRPGKSVAFLFRRG